MIPCFLHTSPPFFFFLFLHLFSSLSFSCGHRHSLLLGISDEFSALDVTPFPFAVSFFHLPFRIYI
ncbi:hypothetical protein BDV23DRAFT_91318 [Aspergillus alliaceus]|uniref:Uncharacterized protein n=1 Tax=Petromyces alliaceus TaxID=209559 RepID=A0A5N7C8X7_PETAA|nr:hypothetical protein BDV23DRAFT_91318 [Aspergillus alliaceus]